MALPLRGTGHRSTPVASIIEKQGVPKGFHQLRPEYHVLPKTSNSDDGRKNRGSRIRRILMFNLAREQ